MFPHLGLGELVVLLVVVLLLFGPNRLPEVAGSFGRSIKSFKEGLRESAKDDTKAALTKESEAQPSQNNPGL